jgi:hypothetical protein
VAANLDVIEDRHGGEQGRALERAAHSDRGDIGSRAIAQRFPVQADVAALGAIKPAQAVKQSGLAGAIRSDQPRNPTFTNGETDIVECDDAAEAHRQLRDFQQRRGRALGHFGLRRRGRRHADRAAIGALFSLGPRLGCLYLFGREMHRGGKA